MSINLYQSDRKRKVWTKKGTSHDWKDTASSLKHGGVSVIACEWMTASGTDSLLSLHWWCNCWLYIQYFLYGLLLLWDWSVRGAVPEPTTTATTQERPSSFSQAIMIGHKEGFSLHKKEAFIQCEHQALMDCTPCALCYQASRPHFWRLAPYGVSISPFPRCDPVTCTSVQSPAPSHCAEAAACWWRICWLCPFHTMELDSTATFPGTFQPVSALSLIRHR